MWKKWLGWFCCSFVFVFTTQCASPLPDLTDFPCRDQSSCGESLRCIEGFCRPPGWKPQEGTPELLSQESYPEESPMDLTTEIANEPDQPSEAGPEVREEEPSPQEPAPPEETSRPEETSDADGGIESGAEETVADKPATEIPEQEPEKQVVEEPVIEKPTPEEPTAEKTAPEEPVIEKPTPEEPVVEKSTPEEPVTEPPPLCQTGETRFCYTGKTGCTSNGKGGYSCLGVCEAGQETCSQGNWGPCVGGITPTQESCSGKDNDCDGKIDNIPDLGQPCQDVKQQGICKDGKWACQGGNKVCVPNETPQPEVCDGKDNDCNGKIDDTADLGTACNEPTRVGVCQQGVRACENNQAVCKQTVQASPEICDNKDNDCNGMVDENLTQSCKTPCGSGTQTCQAGQWSTCSAPQPQLEICDGKDNDCDGLVDENLANCVTVFATYIQRNILHIAVNPAGVVYASDADLHQIVKFDSQGNISRVAGSSQGYTDGAAAQASFSLPREMAFDKAGNLYISDVFNRRIRKLDTQGQVSTTAGTGAYGTLDGAAMGAWLTQSGGLAMDIHDNLYMSVLDTHLIRVITTPGSVMLTLAGAGKPGFQDAQGLSAQFDTPVGVVVGTKGDLYIADYNNHLIRKLDTKGQVSTVAGTAKLGSDDNSDPLLASFNNPRTIATDKQGNLYIADFGNKKVRMIDRTGKVSTLAGGGTNASGPAMQVKFNEVRDVVVSPDGYLYILNSLDKTIYRMDLRGQTQPTMCFLEGSKQSCYTGPSGTDKNSPCLAGTMTCQNNNWNRCEGQVLPTIEDCNGLDDDCDGQIDNNLSIPFCAKQHGVCAKLRQQTCTQGAWLTCADSDYTTHNPLYRTTDSLCDVRDNDCDGQIDEDAVKCASSFAGTESIGSQDGPRLSAQFLEPLDIVFDQAGNMYVVDRMNHRIRKIDTSGQVTTVAGSTSGYKDAQGTNAQFNNPRSVAVDTQGNLYVSDTGNHRIRKIDTQGNVTTVAGSGVPGHKDDTGALAQFNRPAKLLLDGQGNLFVADEDNHRIRMITLSSGKVEDYAGTGVAGSSDGPRLTLAQFRNPISLALDSVGDLLVVDAGNHQIRRISKNTGLVSLMLGITKGYQDGGLTLAQFDNPTSVAIAPSGVMYIVDSGNKVIRQYEPTTQLVTTFAGVLGGGGGFYQVGPLTQTQMLSPVGLAISASGHLFVSDNVLRRIIKMVP